MANTFLRKTSREIGANLTIVGNYTVPANVGAVVVGLCVSNITTDDIEANVVIDNGISSYYILNNAPITDGSSLIVAGKDQKIILQTGDSIKINSSAADSIDVVMSIMETDSIGITSDPVTYSITSNRSSVNEGNVVGFTVSTSNVPNSTVLYWTTVGNVASGDFLDSVTSGNVTIANGSASITRTLTADATIEGVEYFDLALRTGSISGTIVATSGNVTVNDTSQAPLGRVWTAGGNLPTARFSLAGAGTQTAGLGFGGYNSSNLAATEEYDGAAWSSGGNLGTAREGLAGAGTQTAGLGFGGFDDISTSTATEEYDGAAWSSGGNLGTARNALAGAGTQTAGLAIGGLNFGSPRFTTEEYDGAAWSSGGTLGSTRIQLAGCGTQTAGLIFGGATFGGLTAITQEYDGAAWSSGGNLGTARNFLAGAGNQTAGLAFGGSTAGSPTSAVTEEYDGTVWSSGGNLGTARYALAGTGTQTAGLAFGGIISSSTAVTEEYA